MVLHTKARLMITDTFCIEEFSTLDSEECIQILAKLSDEIFGVNTGNTRIRKRLEGKQSLIILIAFTAHDRIPVGFKIGYNDTETVYHSWLGGVLPAYRGQGIATALMEWQHKRIARLGYTIVETRTRNRYKSMLILNIKHGFAIVGTIISNNDVKIILRKQLAPLALGSES